MAGAPALCARGALRAGAGLVTVAVPERIQDVVASFQPEAMTLGLPCDAEGRLGRGALAPLLPAVERADVVVLGPGLGRADATREAVREVVAAVACPLVLDADGLEAHRGRLGDLARRTAPTVLTPHEGEARALLEGEKPVEEDDREARVRRIARAAEAVCVLKGPQTLVSDGARVYVNATGGPVLASGGTGDVLSGVIAALLAALVAAGADAFAAASLAVLVHGAAGDRLAASRGDRGVLASEVADAIPLALRARRAARRRR
jgi:NAD(P)H-hydrate epimerase